MEKSAFHQILEIAVKSKASDIHLKVGSQVLFRINGVLHEVKSPRLTEEITVSLAKIILENTRPLIVAEDLLESRVHLLEVAVETRHAHQVERQPEEAPQILLGG